MFSVVTKNNLCGCIFGCKIDYFFSFTNQKDKLNFTKNKKMQITAAAALAALQDQQKLFVEVFQHGTLSVEMYKPKDKDLQQPHDRDEVYIVLSGSGTFFLEGKTVIFQAGDFLFVPAGAEHRFVDFTDDFATWVLFYGPVGGESNIATPQ
jgi:mannose-6-phosphate isomerase-like protein (cupin superfamily)